MRPEWLRIGVARFFPASACMSGGQNTKTRAAAVTAGGGPAAARKGRRKRGIAGVSGVVADAVCAMERGRGSGSVRGLARSASRVVVVGVVGVCEGARVHGCEGEEDLSAQGGRGNLRVVLTAWPLPEREGEQLVRERTLPTRDPSDRAHNVHEPGTSLLLNGAAVAGSGGGGKPRRYPPSSMTSRGVAFDSAYDRLHAQQSRLGAEGAADLGVHTGRAVGGDYQSRKVAMGYIEARGLSLRAVVDRNRSAWDCGPMPVW